MTYVKEYALCGFLADFAKADLSRAIITTYVYRYALKELTLFILILPLLDYAWALSRLLHFDVSYILLILSSHSWL